MSEHNYYVYIITNFQNTVLYTGVTNNLNRRMFEHKNQINENSFTLKYKCNKLIYFESGQDVCGAIAREKEIKGWIRKKKIIMINKENPEWKDLSEGW